MTNEKILIVDDSPTEMNLVLSALADKGYELITAVDGEEALEKASSELPRLILLDIILPKKNGFQVCRQLKTAPETQDIHVILISSKSQETDKFWGLKQGADEYVTKPFEEDELLAKVNSYMQSN